MNAAAEVLLIIVSSVLAVFLVLAIIVGVKVLQILRALKRITTRAEKIADSAEAATEFFRKSAGPVALGKLISNIVESVMKHKGKGGIKE